MELKKLFNLTGKESGSEIRNKIKEEIKLRKYFNKVVYRAMFTWYERLYLWFKRIRF